MIDEVYLHVLQKLNKHKIWHYEIQVYSFTDQYNLQLGVLISISK
jgi:hypothetical protein